MLSVSLRIGGGRMKEINITDIARTEMWVEGDLIVLIIETTEGYYERTIDLQSVLNNDWNFIPEVSA
tara:strand:+ start:2359 stop:2559 length:201 start_codon:yes stop_codon:yes gene_type:complete